MIPPAYTRAAIYDGPLPENGLSGLVGTRIEVRARSNRPLSGGAVELASQDDRETIRLDTGRGPMKPHEKSSVRGRSLRPGTFQLNVTDVAGQDSLEPFTGNISVLEDQFRLSG